ncbi:uncharacterized protein EV420DRAFT_1662997 [Desarmillaria tabescens]|uniref:Uncharacterized protein n=1 Tax=Armillaria tabescens TaxID=1929756 RepID=A0AA39NQN9_ARMTA|nr:uncharacterized protein EV420DRAFT_1662997 [Desarmillaria tabescens]KAK0470056.1 hypothetical protein EV420DRAFT_1662997 [Desarmillaria tabescens]
MAMPISDLVFISILLQMLLYDETFLNPTSRMLLNKMIGMYTCLFLEALYLLIFRRKRSKVIVVMTILNIIMWSVVTTNVGLNMGINTVRFLRQNGIENVTVFDEYATPEIYLQLALEGINIVIGDGVVIWRAWLLWNQRRWILVVSSFLLLGTGVTIANVAYALSISPITLDNLFDDPKLSTWGIAAMALTTMTNLFATSLIVYRGWTHHRLLRSLTGESVISHFCKQNGILTLLIESGVFYCCTWIATIILFVATNNGITLMLDVLSQLTAIYPTLIIILVSLRSTLDIAIQSVEQTCRQPSTSPRPLSLHTSPLSVAVETAVYVSSENIESFPVDSLKSQDVKDSTTLC